MDNSIGIILKALRFSAIKHRDQRRKDIPETPYINHPIQVAETLWELGGVSDGEVLAAAILHDTIEDTVTSPDEIRASFGEKVLSLVLEVTDDKSLPKDERKRQQIERAPNLSFEAKMIKLADKICNLGDILHSPPPDWSLQRREEYLLWTEQVIAGVRGTNAALEKQYDATLEAGKRILGVS